MNTDDTNRIEELARKAYLAAEQSREEKRSAEKQRESEIRDEFLRNLRKMIGEDLVSYLIQNYDGYDPIVGKVMFANNASRLVLRCVYEGQYIWIENPNKIGLRSCNRGKIQFFTPSECRQWILEQIGRKLRNQ